MSRWPKDNQTALIKFYGDPGTGETARQLVKVTPPFKMYYDGKLLKTISFHAKAAPALLSALNKVWDYYGHDQETIDKLGISKTAGTFNPRKIRGSKTKWSNHAYGAAIDINAEQNAFNVAGNIPPVMIAAFKSEGFRWGGDYKGRKDPMHFEACDSGEPDRSFEQWLKVLGVKPSPAITKVGPELALPAREVSKPDVPDHVQEDFAEPVPQSNDVENVQKWLKQIGYVEVGEVDGKFGSRTTAAIAAFKKDWNLTGLPVIDEQLKTVLQKAIADNWKRPIAPARSEASATYLAPKLPEVQAAQTAERIGFWGSIAAAVSTVVTGIMKFAGDAVGLLNPIKSFVGDLPWPVWVAVALFGSLALYYVSKKSGDAKNEATKAYQEGARV